MRGVSGRDDNDGHVTMRRLVWGSMWPMDREVLVGSPWAGVAQW